MQQWLSLEQYTGNKANGGGVFIEKASNATPKDAKIRDRKTGGPPE
jgi:hypothetical protein